MSQRRILTAQRRLMRRTLHVILPAVAASSAICAAADQMPTDVELKASYCLAIKRSGVAMLRSVLAQLQQNSPVWATTSSDLARTENDLKRLQSYMVPKLGHLDSTALLLARRRADDDMAAFMPQANACLDRCASVTMGTPKWQVCSDKCRADDPLIARIDSCNKLDWLPF